MEKTIKVLGMTCNHCKESVENALKTLDGVRDVEVDLDQDQVKITADKIDMEEIEEAIDEIGFELGE